MIQFPSLTDAGAGVAAMSGCAEGDCGSRPEATGNRAQWFAGLGVEPDRVAGARQVHGRHVVEAVSGSMPEADGLITRDPGVVLSIAVADCVPVFLYAARPRAIALVHAGRAGTLENISGAAVRMLEDAYGCDPGSMWAVIGPSICGHCYEVDPEMAEAFEAAGYVARGRYVDLWATNHQQLLEAGVGAGQVVVSGICTLEDGRLYSFRRDRTAERNLAVLAL